MSRYFSIYRNFSSTSTSFFTPGKNEVFVGRWSIPNKNTDIVINQICDRNNEDHCGACITNDTNTNSNPNLIKKNIVDDHNDHDDDDYLRPYFM
jgi:hypothetical protein